MMLCTEHSLILLEQAVLRLGTHEVVVSWASPRTTPHSGTSTVTPLTFLLKQMFNVLDHTTLLLSFTSDAYSKTYRGGRKGGNKQEAQGALMHLHE